MEKTKSTQPIVFDKEKMVYNFFELLKILASLYHMSLVVRTMDL